MRFVRQSVETEMKLRRKEEIRMKSTNNSTWKKVKVPQGKHHNKTATKTTVSLYLNRKLVERARNRRLNLSRVTEQALSSILDYLEPQNNQKSSIIPLQDSIPKKVKWTEGDLNPRLPPCEGGDHTRLIYRPDNTIS